MGRNRNFVSRDELSWRGTEREDKKSLTLTIEGRTCSNHTCWKMHGVCYIMSWS